MLKTLTELNLKPLPKKNNQQCVQEFTFETLNDATNYGIFEYSNESQFKYANVKKFYPKTYPVQNSPKIKVEHWTN